MKRFYRQICFLCVSLLCLSTACLASSISLGSTNVSTSQITNAITEDRVATLTGASLATYSAVINNMDAYQFDDFMFGVIQNSDDLTTLEDNLKLLGIEFGAQAPGIEPNKMYPSDFEREAYHARRVGEDLYHLYFTVATEEREARPGSVDIISFYFDTRVAYYDGNYSSSRYVSLNDASYYQDGVITFNYEDANIPFNSNTGLYGYEMVGVHVRPTVDSGTLNFGATLHHTYEVLKAEEITGDVEVGYSEKMVNGHINVSVTGRNGEEVVKAAADNAVYF